MKMKKTAISLVLALAMVFSLVLVAAPVAEAAGHTTHCVCGGKAVGIGDHTCADVTGEWKDLNAYVGTNGASLATGNYYLSADLTLTNATTLQLDQSNAVVTICLNGFKLLNTGSDGRAVYVRSTSEASTLNICDCKETGEMITQCVNQGAVIRTEKNEKDGKLYSGTVNLYSGTLTGSEVETAGGTVRICRGTLNIYAATLQNGKHVVANNSWAGNLMISDNATCNMYGGVIKDGSVQAGGKGANVYVSSGCHFNIYGGAISGGVGSADIGCATGANVMIKNLETSCTMQAYGNLTLDDTELDRTVTIGAPDVMGVYTITKSDVVPEDPTEPPVVEPTQEPTQEPTRKPTQEPTQEPTAGSNDGASQDDPDITVLIIGVVVALAAAGVVVFVVVRNKKK